MSAPFWKAKRLAKRYLDTFIYIFKAQLKHYGMKREEQELLERAEGNESWEEKPEIEVNEKDESLEDEFDREFWLMTTSGSTEPQRTKSWRTFMGFRFDGDLA